MAEISLEKLSKVFPDGTNAVSELDLEIANGEFVVLVGPSGCGKTTALRMVAGLEEPTSGEIRIGGDLVTNVPPKKRDIAMVFQDYALYPQMTVFDNMAFALKLQKMPKAVIRERVNKAAAILHLEGLLHRRPRALSGGQRQRVAMGRAIVREPRAFLLDEPLSNLDAKLRVQMRAEIARIQRTLGVTTIYVTHDQTEAMTMGDRVAVMNRGVLQQIAPPEELYRRPLNLFTAGFIGAPAMNLVEAQLRREGDQLEVAFGGHRLRCSETLLDARPALAAYEGRAVVLGIRPEHFEDAALTTAVPAEHRLTVNVDVREALGSETLLLFSVDGQGVVPEHIAVPASDAGVESTDDDDDDDDGLFADRPSFVARVNANSKAMAGDTLQLTVDVGALQFFDAESGLAIYGDRS
jgi:multiple sugar transport system ATP-binding protein